MHDAIALKDVQAWVKHRAPPLCTFMPDRLSDANGNAINQANFRQLSRLLYEKQMVAIAPWRVPERLPGAGIIIYPTQTSSGMLVGAIFLTAGFPDFVAAALQPPTGSSRLLYGATGSPESSLSSSSRHPQYQSYPAHYAQPHTTPSPSSGNEGTSAYNSVHGSGQGQR
ncbi:hypothetical protein SERLADRAFT_412990 [Serpula lacrymans var. lacrymans S7.9]|nr:uncharacterized protein SERLADRAFT_412990 [Serpula lacrymans var. lacrymans S7.9]EGO29534.1 hypothetical protein SERLADRAFT_412990 [Serpula lacrymans var. lacrymans S7.9]